MKVAPQTTKQSTFHSTPYGVKKNRKIEVRPKGLGFTPANKVNERAARSFKRYYNTIGKTKPITATTTTNNVQRETVKEVKVSQPVSTSAATCYNNVATNKERCRCAVNAWSEKITNSILCVYEERYKELVQVYPSSPRIESSSNDFDLSDVDIDEDDILDVPRDAPILGKGKFHPRDDEVDEGEGDEDCC